MPGVAVAVVAALTFMSVVHSSLASTTRANIKLLNNGYEGILIAIAETAPVSESDKIIRWIKVGGRAVDYSDTEAHVTVTGCGLAVMSRIYINLNSRNRRIGLCIER